MTDHPHFETVDRVLDAHSGPRGRMLAVADPDAGLTFAELHRAAQQAARWLDREGFEPGDRLVIVAKPSVALFALFFACARLGLVYCLLNTRLNAQDIADQCADAAPRLTLFDDACAALTEQVAGSKRPLAPVVADWANLSGDPVESRAKADDPLVMMFTSGTTGRAKGVLVTHRAWLAARSQDHRLGDWFTFTPSDKTLVVTPLFHIAGLGYAFIPLYHGYSVRLVPDFVPAQVIETIRTHAPTRTLLVPAMLALLMQDKSFDPAHLASLKLIAYGAAPMPVALLDAGRRALPNTRFVQLYGMTETVGSGTVLAPDDHEDSRRATSVGRPYPHIEISVRRPDGTPCQTLETGEVWLKTPTVMREYFGRPEPTSEVLQDGWYRTGDGGYLDGEGYLYLKDRIKDMIITGGENVFPSEIEAVLRRLPQVQDAAVVGTPHPVWGEAVTAALVLKDGEDLLPAALTAAMMPHLAGFKRPRRLVLLSALPRNPSGKVLKRDIRALYDSAPERFVALVDDGTDTGRA